MWQGVRKEREANRERERNRESYKDKVAVAFEYVHAWSACGWRKFNAKALLLAVVV